MDSASKEGGFIPYSVSVLLAGQVLDVIRMWMSASAHLVKMAGRVMNRTHLPALLLLSTRLRASVLQDMQVTRVQGMLMSAAAPLVPMVNVLTWLQHTPALVR